MQECKLSDPFQLHDKSHAFLKNQKSPFSKNEIIDLLQCTGKEQEHLFERARESRRQAFGDKALIRGVIEVSNICRQNCGYCPMRVDNKNKDADFMMDAETILDTVRAIRDNGINVVFFQAGENPKTTPLMLEVIPKVREIFGGPVEILLCLGNKPYEEYAALKKAGATSYILKHETSDPELHRRLRHQSFEHRLKHLHYLLELGYYVGTGNIIGLPGQDLGSIAGDLLLARELGVHMASSSPFIPAPSTPLVDSPTGSVNTTLNAIAIMRIMGPHYLIPAVSALEKLEEGGQLRGIHAGANVMTVNFTPKKHKEMYHIYGKNRYIVKKDHIEKILEKAGLVLSQSFYA